MFKLLKLHFICIIFCFSLYSCLYKAKNTPYIDYQNPVISQADSGIYLSYGTIAIIYQDCKLSRDKGCYYSIVIIGPDLYIMEDVSWCKSRKPTILLKHPIKYQYIGRMSMVDFEKISFLFASLTEVYNDSTLTDVYVEREYKVKDYLVGDGCVYVIIKVSPLIWWLKVYKISFTPYDTPKEWQDIVFILNKYLDDNYKL